LLWPLLTTINGHGRDVATTLELTDIGDGRASIRIAAEVSWEVARKLADLIMPPKARSRASIEGKKLIRH
jgi:hypothetical protein